MCANLSEERSNRFASHSDLWNMDTMEPYCPFIGLLGNSNLISSPVPEIPLTSAA